jgi:hypothetical protein
MYEKFERGCKTAVNGSPEYNIFMLISFGTEL